MREAVPERGPIRVAVVDDEAQVRRTFGRILARLDYATCVGEFASGEDALERIPDSDAQVVLMDIVMPGICGIECTRQLVERCPGMRVVLVTALPDQEVIASGLNVGAVHYLVKPVTIRQLEVAVRLVMSPGLTKPEIDYDPEEECFFDRQCPVLTPRQREVIELCKAGLTTKEIAVETGVSESMAKKLMRQVLAAFRARNGVQAVSRYERCRRCDDGNFDVE